MQKEIQVELHARIVWKGLCSAFSSGLFFLNVIGYLWPITVYSEELRDVRPPLDVPEFPWLWVLACVLRFASMIALTLI